MTLKLNCIKPERRPVPHPKSRKVNPIRSGVFETLNAQVGGGDFKSPATISKILSQSLP